MQGGRTGTDSAPPIITYVCHKQRTDSAARAEPGGIRKDYVHLARMRGRP